MAELKPAYLIHGSDEAKLDAWRARVRARADQESPAATLELLRGEALTGESFAASMSALTLSAGRRYVLADGVERWRERDAKEAVAALAQPPPDTIVVLIAAAEKVPAALVKAVEKLGGEVHVCGAPKDAAYPRWAADRARELGFELDREAAQVLVERMPREEKPRRLRQQSLMRELEKLAVYAGDDHTVSTHDVEALTVPAVEARVYELADAVVEGDAQGALRLADGLRARGEDNMMLILFTVSRRLRDCRRVQRMLAAGRPVDEIPAALGVPPWMAKRVIAQARRADEEHVERVLELLADLDCAVRGFGELDPDSALTRMLTGWPEPAGL